MKTKATVKNIGKLLKAGSVFYTSTKLMSKDRRSYTKWNKEHTGPLNTYEVLKQGDERFFQKGKRRYFCQVLGLVEVKTGLYMASIQKPEHSLNNKISGKRYYQFTYLVKVVEN